MITLPLLPANDSGYPHKLLTPFYPRVKRKCVPLSLLKCRWRSLDASPDRLLYQPAKVCKLIRARGMLHNKSQRIGIPRPPGPSPTKHKDPGPEPPP